MQTISTSLQAAANDAGHEPRMLVELHTAVGVRYLARERVRWSGVDYEPRLEADPTIRVSGGGGTGVIPRASLSLEIADGDFAFRRLRPHVLRGHRCTVREVFLAVDSEALRTTTFTMNGSVTVGGARLSMSGQETLGEVTRELVPPLGFVVDERMYPGAATTENVYGRPIPLCYGNGIFRIWLADESGASPADGDVYLACFAGSGTQASLGSSGVYERDTTLGSQNKLSPITAAGPGGPTTLAYSFRAVTRDAIEVAEVHMDRALPNGQNVPRFAHLQSPLGADVTPDRVLADLLTHAGAGALVDSESFAAAGAIWEAQSHYFDAMVDAQEPVENLLDAWAHDALARIRVGEKLSILAISSRAVVGSLAPENIVRGSITMTDVGLGAEGSRRVLTYRDRTQDPDVSFRVTAAAGSGSIDQRESRFIGRGLVAQRVCDTWARIEAAGVRRYRLRATLGAAMYDEGDLVHFTHSEVNADRVQCEVVAAARQGPSVTYELREQPPHVFGSPPQGGDVQAFRTRYHRVPYNGGSFQVGNGFPTSVVITSHSLGQTPRFVRVVTTLGPLESYIVAASLHVNYFTNDSSALIHTEGFIGPIRLDEGQHGFLGWDLFA